MGGQRDDLRFRLYEAICRYCNALLRKYSRGFAQNRADFAQQAWVDVCEDPDEEHLALTELETHDRLAPGVKRCIRNAIDRQKRYCQKTRPIGGRDLVAQPNWYSDPAGKEQWARVVDACSPEDLALFGLSPVRRTQREEATSQGITDRTFRNRRKHRLERLKSLLNQE